MKDKKAFTLIETLKRHSEGTKVTEESLACHCEEVAGQPTWQSRENKILDCFTFVRNDKKCKCAFTLAEALIVLVILGIIASITIPSVVRRQMEAQNRTRIKKSMTVYDTAINKMVVENQLKSDIALQNFAGENCENSINYFKVVEFAKDENGVENKCRFRASDGVWWNIENITKPIIGFNEDDIEAVNSTTSFQLFGHFGSNGELRVDDVAYEEQHDFLTDKEKENLLAMYDFANNVKKSEVAKDAEDLGQSSFFNKLGYNFNEDDYDILKDEKGRVIEWRKILSREVIDGEEFFAVDYSYNRVQYDDENKEVKITSIKGEVSAINSEIYDYSGKLKYTEIKGSPGPGQRITRTYPNGCVEVYDKQNNLLESGEGCK